MRTDGRADGHETNGRNFTNTPKTEALIPPPHAAIYGTNLQ
jgi:hypothetical protein